MVMETDEPAIMNSILVGASGRYHRPAAFAADDPYLYLKLFRCAGPFQGLRRICNLPNRKGLLSEPPKSRQP